jgi:antitoxin YefM
MPIETTYTNARNNLASLLDQVIDDREIVVINRRGREGVAMVSESELSGLLETAHLLRSPANAARLEAAMRSVAEGKGERITVDELRKEFGVETRKKKTK